MTTGDKGSVDSKTNWSPGLLASRCSLPVNETEPVDGVMDVPIANAKPQGPEEELRLKLQDALHRSVSTPHESFAIRLKRGLTNPILLATGATVGVGIASVLTAGTVHIGLLAVGGAATASNDSSFMDWWKSKKRGTVHLDSAAVEFLLDCPGQEVVIVHKALSLLPPGSAYLKAQFLEEVQKANWPKKSDRRRLMVLHDLRSRVGIALMAAGLFMIAVVVVPEYIHAPTLRAAAALVAIGAILYCLGLVESP